MCYNYETLIHKGIRRQIHELGKDKVLADLSDLEKKIWKEQFAETDDQLQVGYVYEAYEKKSIFPGNEALVIPITTGVAENYFYGFLPQWATAFNDQRKNYNCRSDSIRVKPTWKKAWTNNQRCLIIASGFFETNKETKKRYFFSVTGKEVIYFAGIFNHWNDESGKTYKTFAMITHEPNELVNQFHNRMPVILDRAGASTWLSDATEEKVFELLQSYPAQLMQITEAPAPPRNKKRGNELELDF